MCPGRPCVPPSPGHRQVLAERFNVSLTIHGFQPQPQAEAQAQAPSPSQAASAAPPAGRSTTVPLAQAATESSRAPPCVLRVVGACPSPPPGPQSTWDLWVTPSGQYLAMLPQAATPSRSRSDDPAPAAAAASGSDPESHRRFMLAARAAFQLRVAGSRPNAAGQSILALRESAMQAHAALTRKPEVAVGPGPSQLPGQAGPGGVGPQAPASPGPARAPAQAGSVPLAVAKATQARTWAQIVAGPSPGRLPTTASTSVSLRLSSESSMFAPPGPLLDSLALRLAGPWELVVPAAPGPQAGATHAGISESTPVLGKVQCLLKGRQ